MGIHDNVGDRNLVAVLDERGQDILRVEEAAVRGHALNELMSGRIEVATAQVLVLIVTIRERSIEEVTSELHRLSAVLVEGLGLAKLLEHKVRHGTLEQVFDNEGGCTGRDVTECARSVLGNIRHKMLLCV